MEPTKKSRVFKNNLILFAIALVVAAVYLSSRAILSDYEIYYRTWVIVVGDLITYIILPFVTFVLPITAALQRKKNAPERRGGGAVVAVAAVLSGVVMLLYSGIAFVGFVFTADEEFETERMLTGDILEGIRWDMQGFDGHIVYHYYEPISFFMKKTYEPLSEALEVRAYEKYGEEFTACDEDKELEQQMFLRMYTMQSVEHPQIVMHMFSGGEVWGISDDYMQARANWILSQNMDFAAIAEMPLEVTEEEAQGPAERMWQGPTVLIYTEDYGRKVAGTIADAITQVISDEKFEEAEDYHACITLLFHYSDGHEDDMQIEIEDYATEEWIQEKIAEAYADYTPITNEYVQSDKADDNEQVAEPDTSTAQTVEGAYLRLYKEVFEPLGEPYECSYNAKGNFYALLSRGEGTPSGSEQKMETAQTVVYDRVSKNGECHLFVHYKTYYHVDGSEYGTSICNTYAVNMKTGEITPSGKQSWEDVGTQEYQIATGEE